MVAPEPVKKPATVTAEGSLLTTAINLWGYVWPAGRPDLKWRLGVSASTGSYLDHEAHAYLPPGLRVDDYRQIVLLSAKCG